MTLQNRHGVHSQWLSILGVTFRVTLQKKPKILLKIQTTYIFMFKGLVIKVICCRLHMASSWGSELWVLFYVLFKIWKEIQVSLPQLHSTWKKPSLSKMATNDVKHFVYSLAFQSLTFKVQFRVFSDHLTKFGTQISFCRWMTKSLCHFIEFLVNPIVK